MTHTYYRYIRRNNLIALVIAYTVFSLLSFSHAQALTQYTYLISPSSGEFAWTCRTTSNPDRSSYLPGQTATIVVSGSIMYDAGAPTSGTGNCLVYLFNNTSNTGPAFDTEATSYGSTMIANTGTFPASGPISRTFSGSYSFTVPASMSPGSHTVRFLTTAVGGTVGGGSASGVPSVTNPLSFTVTSPVPPPTVILFFSFGQILNLFTEKLFASS